MFDLVLWSFVIAFMPWTLSLSGKLICAVGHFMVFGLSRAPEEAAEPWSPPGFQDHDPSSTPRPGPGARDAEGHWDDRDHSPSRPAPGMPAGGPRPTGSIRTSATTRSTTRYPSGSPPIMVVRSGSAF